MLVLGLDPSLTNYGWALHDTEAEGSGRVLDRGRFRTKRKDFPNEVRRYRHLREALRSKILELQPDAMGIEHPVYNEDYSEGMFALFMFSLDAIEECRQDIVMFAPPQVKRFAKDLLDRPRRWKMGKSDMIDAARHHTGGGMWDHNEADAYLVAALAGRFWSFFVGDLEESDLTKYEKVTFTQIRTITKGRRAGQTEIKGILHREGDRFFLWSME